VLNVELKNVNLWMLKQATNKLFLSYTTDSFLVRIKRFNL